MVSILRMVFIHGWLASIAVTTSYTVNQSARHFTWISKVIPLYPWWMGIVS